MQRGDDWIILLPHELKHKVIVPGVVHDAHHTLRTIALLPLGSQHRRRLALHSLELDGHLHDGSTPLRMQLLVVFAEEVVRTRRRACLGHLSSECGQV